MPFALKEETASARSKHDVWYRFWTQIGPCCTSDPEQRALLRTREEWVQSRALRHPLCFFEIIELPEGAAGDFDWDT